MTFDLGTMKGEYIHRAASRAADYSSTIPIVEGEGFGKKVAASYQASEGVDLWARNTTRVKAMLRRLFHSRSRREQSIDASSGISTGIDRAEDANDVEKQFALEWNCQGCDIIFDMWSSVPFYATPSTFMVREFLRKMDPSYTYSLVFLAAFLVRALSYALKELREGVVHYSDKEDTPDHEVLHDLALRLGTLIFEALIQIQSADREGVSKNERLGLLAFAKGFLFSLSTARHESPISIRCFFALWSAALEYRFIERNVDAVFEEIVLA